MTSMGLIRNSFETIRANLCRYSGGNVLLRKDESTGIAEIIFDRPEKRNAISGQMMVDLRDCVENLESWGTGRGVIINGRGAMFCSGGDLNFARASTPQDGYDMSVWMQDALVRLQKLSLVSCCLVHGACLGGGSEVSVFCDYIVAADDVKYGFVEGRMGITSAWGGGCKLVQKVGRRKALDLLLTCKIMSAEECLAAGLVDLVVSTSNALEETRAWFLSKLQLEREIIRATKRIILERWDSGKGVILSGRGKHFCSGIDLSLARNSPPLNGAIISKWVQDALVRLERLPLVSCCLVHGACLGGGSELSMFCDYVAVGDDVKYGFVQGKMGVTTAWGGGTRLSRKIGQRKALELLLTSKVMDAQECLSAGVADVILSSEEGVVEWLRDKLCRDPQITRALKSVVNNTRFYDDNECLARETSIFAPFWGGNIHKEILEANVKH
ncbi:hypothetical protein FQR65_LT12312 [Abscondita terminalis]|nr:hypothetical protein FQR65_LT12312 [Abscondita terminalis]